jgi:hypothetical protein
MILGTLFVSIAALTSPQAFAWSVEGHQLITTHAVELLPAPWRQFFGYYDWFLTEAASYPDTYYRSTDSNEGPRHYVDLEIWNPNDRSTGTLPQSVEEFALKMQTALEAKDWNSAFLFAGRVAHYVEDDTQPYHTTVNYNPTNKMGVGLHSVLDSSIIAHISEINILQASEIGALTPIDNLTAFVLNMAYDSHSFLPAINRTLIDEGLDWSPELTRIIENRTNTAIIAVARVWQTVITRANAFAPEIRAGNQLFIITENVTQSDNGLTLIRLRVIDSLGIRTYANVTLTTDKSIFRGQVANAIPPIGEYIVVAETGLHPNDHLTAQREGYSSATLTIGNTAAHITSLTEPSSLVTSSLLNPIGSDVPAITIVALVVMFCGILALVVLRRVPMDN